LYLFSETSWHFRNKKREYLKDKIDELAMNSKNKNIRDLYKGINDFKRGYQPSSNLVVCKKLVIKYQVCKCKVYSGNLIVRPIVRN
jgi:predicted NACHT family NTPase